MRCLKCHRDGIAETEDTCPGCGFYLPQLPQLLRDALPPNTMLHAGKYQIEYAIGRGGFGITYRAVHVDLGQRVAIKEFFPQEQAARHVETGSLTVATAARPAFEKALTRFLEEGRLLARLNQPNVVQVRDFFKERETAYLVMEYLSGQTLRSELDAAPGGKLAEQRVREVMSALVGALSACHEEGIYHLDIKPENVMVETSGRIVLIDFGASRQGLGTQTTRAFTPGYAPPELMISGMAVGPQSDVFELGMLLHELLTGKLPPDAVSRAFKDDWQPQEVSEPYAGLIRQALRLKREQRPSHVAVWWQGVEAKPAVVAVPSPSPREVAPELVRPVVTSPAARIVKAAADKVRGLLQAAADRARGPVIVVRKTGRRALLLRIGLVGLVVALGIPLIRNLFWGFGGGGNRPKDPQQGDTWINPKDGAEMVFIPAGLFQMGDADRTNNPPHPVMLSGYWIYKNVVTVKQYLKFCADTGYARPLAPSFDPNWSEKDHPIVNVSWDDAKAYCDWAGVRLPTEAEWEKAARGTEGRTYPWEKPLFDRSKLWCSNTVRMDAGCTTSVGKYGISPYGLSDMAGNVWQWCSDWYDSDYCKTDHGADPTGPASGWNRVLRGGGWRDWDAVAFRSAGRFGAAAPDHTSDMWGFRGARGL